MWQYLVPIAGLAALCGAWVLFQRWIARVDPEQGDCAGRGCGECGCRHPKGGGVPDVDTSTENSL